MPENQNKSANTARDDAKKLLHLLWDAGYLIVPGNKLRHAAEIVASVYGGAVNSHDALVEALELSIGWMKYMQTWNPFGTGPSPNYTADLAKAEAALKLVKE